MLIHFGIDLYRAYELFASVRGAGPQQSPAPPPHAKRSLGAGPNQTKTGFKARMRCAGSPKWLMKDAVAAAEALTFWLDFHSAEGHIRECERLAAPYEAAKKTLKPLLTPLADDELLTVGTTSKMREAVRVSAARQMMPAPCLSLPLPPLRTEAAPLGAPGPIGVLQPGGRVHSSDGVCGGSDAARHVEPLPVADSEGVEIVSCIRRVPATPMSREMKAERAALSSGPPAGAPARIMEFDGSGGSPMEARAAAEPLTPGPPRPAPRRAHWSLRRSNAQQEIEINDDNDE